MRTIAYILIMMVLIPAALALASPRLTTPGSVFWKAEIFLENMREKMTRDIDKKMEVMIRHARERLDERENMIIAGNENAAIQAEEELGIKLREMRDLLDDHRRSIDEYLEEGDEIRDIMNMTSETSHKARMRIEIRSNGSWSNVSFNFTVNDMTKAESFLINTTDTRSIAREISSRTGIPLDYIEDSLREVDE